MIQSLKTKNTHKKQEVERLYYGLNELETTDLHGFTRIYTDSVGLVFLADSIFGGFWGNLLDFRWSGR